MPAPSVAPGQLSCKAHAGETDGVFIPQPHLTHRLLMIHLFTIQSFCSAGGTSCRVRSWEEEQGLPPLLLIEAFPVGDSQAAFQAPEQPTNLFHLLQSAGKHIPIVCPRLDMLLMNHSHSQEPRTSGRCLYNAELPALVPVAHLSGPVRLMADVAERALLQGWKRGPSTEKTIPQGTTRQHLLLHTRQPPLLAAHL